MRVDEVAAPLAAAIFGLSFLACAAIISILLKKDLAWRVATDVPNERSLHSAPIPRIGGWGIVPPVVAISWLFGGEYALLTVLVGMLFAVSYADDRLDMPIFIRFPAHAAAAAAWLAYGPVELPLAIAVPAGICMVWITNLFNFMDGADGLAGGMALFAFGVYAFVAAQSGLVPLAVWSTAIAGAAAGFLFFNFSPARVFLGDAGSITLGFTAGAFGVWGWSASAWPLWFPFLVSGPFFVDATVTIVRRILARERFWRAHRDHYYQRLIRSGWSHRRTACYEYALMAASAALAVMMLGWTEPAQYGGLAASMVGYAGIARAVDRRWAMFVVTAGVAAKPASSEPHRS